MSGISHIFFDLDRTLWDFDSNSRETLVELFAEFELAKSLAVNHDQFVTEYKKINEAFWNDYRIGKIQKEELRYARFDATLQHFKLSDRSLAEQLGELYVSRSPRKTALIDGAIEILEYLQPKYRLHIITNGFEEVQHIKVKSSGLEKYFEQIITSEAAAAKKPDVRIFDHAERLTGSIPANSMMIGDHYEADVVGALTAGWKAIFFEPKEHRIENGGFAHIHALSELKDLL